MQYLIRDLIVGRDYEVQIRAIGSSGTSEWSPVIQVTSPATPSPPAPVISESSIVSTGTAFSASWTYPPPPPVVPATDFSHFELDWQYWDGSSWTSASEIISTITPSYVLTIEENSAIFADIPRPKLRLRVRAVAYSGASSTWSASHADNGLGVPPWEQNPPPRSPPVVPDDVPTVTAVPGVNVININWSAATFDDYDYSEVYAEATNSTTTSTSKIARVTGTSYVHTTTDYASPRFYKVKHFDKFGQPSEVAGVSSSSVVPNSSALSDTTPPADPTSVTATAAVDTSDPTGSSVYIDVSWVNPGDTDFAGSKIRYSTSNSSGWSYVDVPPTASSYRIRGLRAGTQYYVSVLAYDSFNNDSGWSNASTYPTAAVSDTTAPVQVTGVSVSSGLRNSVVSWTDVSDNDVRFGRGTYEVQRDIVNTFTNPVSVKVSGTVAGFTGLVTLTNYYYRVRAIDFSNNPGDWSAVSGPHAPGQSTATDLAINSVTADQIAADSVTGVKILAGEITADKVQANTTFTQNLNVGDDVGYESAPGGGITVTGAQGYVKSNPFVSGASGWRIDNNGIEANNFTARKTFSIESSQTATPTFKASSTTTRTLTFASHPFVSGQVVQVALSPPDPNYDGTRTISGVSPTTITFTAASLNQTSTAASGEVVGQAGERVRIDQNGIKLMNGSDIGVFLNPEGIAGYKGGVSTGDDKTFLLERATGKVNITGSFNITGAVEKKIDVTSAGWQAGSPLGTVTLTVPSGHGLAVGNMIRVSGVYRNPSRTKSTADVMSGLLTVGTTENHLFRAGDLVTINDLHPLVDGSHILLTASGTSFTVALPSVQDIQPAEMGSASNGIRSDLYDGTYEVSATTGTTVSYKRASGKSTESPVTAAPQSPVGGIYRPAAGVSMDSNEKDSQIRLFSAGHAPSEIPAAISAYAGKKFRIISRSRASNVATIGTAVPHSVIAGERIFVDIVLNPTFSGFFTVTEVGTNTIKYASTGSDVSSSTVEGTAQTQNAGRLQIVSPKAADSPAASWISLEPGADRTYVNPITQNPDGVNRAGTQSFFFSGDGSNAFINQTDFTRPSNSRIVLSAGEVLWAGGLGRSVSVDVATGWRQRGGAFGGLYLVQELDGYWALQGLVESIAAISPAAPAEITIIDPAGPSGGIPPFARPATDEIFPLMARTTNPLETDIIVRGRVKSTGQVTITVPSWIPNTTNTETSTAQNSLNDTQNTHWFTAARGAQPTANNVHQHAADNVGATMRAHTHTAWTRVGFGSTFSNNWVSLSGIRWKARPANELGSRLVV